MPRRKSKAVAVRLPPRGDRRAFLEACARLTPRAWVRLDEKNGRMSAALTPRSASAAGLAAAWRAEYDEALARRRSARAGLALEAAVLSRALELAAHVDARRREPPPELASERKAEIAALLAEADAAPKDPLGIATPWSELRKKA
jgi:hypothetical protein